MRWLPATIGAAVATLAASLGPPAGAEPAASATLDRTVVCSIGIRAGVRKVEVHARTGTRLFDDPTKWKFLASAEVRDPSFVGRSAAWIAAGWPPALEPGQEPSGVTLSVALRCTATTARVPLTTRGLSGFPASPLDDEYHCVVSRRVLVRVRAVFRAPTTLRPNRKWGTLEGRGIVREGVLAVRTESGAPVALATVHESGKSRLYVADRCRPDLIQSDG
jgi:hypothetical protein